MGTNVLQTTIGYVSDPWNVPVPVRTAEFVPLKPRDERFNIQCDPARVEPFAFTSRYVAARDLLYSDLQTNGDHNSPAHLGSGRSGFFAGRYLKGVGRTPLAANWNDRGDVYHGSGHLFPSAAAREYLISCALDARGLGDAINGCDGLLVATAPVGTLMRSMIKSSAHIFRARAAACDMRLAAITTKPSHFARPSNFIWSLNHYSPDRAYVASFLTRLFYYLQPKAGAVDQSALTPRTIADALSSAVERALGNFRAYLKLGLYWGSFHNNFTLDGRFLDIELPLFLGRPFIGVLDMGTRPLKPYDAWMGGPIMGFDVQHYLHQMRYFLLFLRARIQFILSARLARGTARDFLRDFLRELRRRFDPSSILFSAAAQERLTLAMLNEVFDLSSAQQTLLRKLIHVKRLSLENLPGPAHSPVRLKRIKLPLANIEPGLAVNLYGIDGLPEFEPALSPDAERLNQGLIQIERETDPHGFLEEVRSTEHRIRAQAA